MKMQQSIFYLISFAVIVAVVMFLTMLGGCEKPRTESARDCKPDTVFIPVYEGYIHPSGDYKWTKKGWQALRPFVKLSPDSSKLIIIK